MFTRWESHQLNSKIVNTSPKGPKMSQICVNPLQSSQFICLYCSISIYLWDEFNLLSIMSIFLCVMVKQPFLLVGRVPTVPKKYVLRNAKTTVKNGRTCLHIYGTVWLIFYMIPFYWDSFPTMKNHDPISLFEKYSSWRESIFKLPSHLLCRIASRSRWPAGRPLWVLMVQLPDMWFRGGCAPCTSS